jgi:MFS transporter, FHS family, L-fucose permease
MALIARPMRGLFYSLFGTFTLFGTSMTIVGGALPSILDDFRWSYAAAGAVIAASAAGYVLMSFLSGKVMKRFGAKATMVAGLSACVVGLAFFAATPSFPVNFLLNLLIGAGQGLIEPAVNWSALRMDEDGAGRPVNLLHGSFSIGAVAGPLILSRLIAAGLSWTILFRVIAVLFALLAVALAAMPFSRLGKMDGAKGAPRPAWKSSRGPAFYLGFACLLLYVGVEIGISNWIAEYFVRIFGSAPALASLAVSLFWGGILAGRFGVPALYRGTRLEAGLVAVSLLLIASTAALCVLGFLGLSGIPLWVPAALTFLAGLGCSIVYPTVISLVGFSCKGYQAEAVSFSVSGGGVGLLAFPLLMSWISQGFGILAGFASYAVIAILTALSCAALARTFSEERKAARAP